MHDTVTRDSRVTSDARRVVLVELTWTRDKDPRVPLGHASLLSALRASTPADVRSVVVPTDGHDAVESAAASILAHTSGVDSDRVDVAVAAYVWAEDELQRLLPRLRQGGFRGRIILGGPQISYARGGLEQVYPDATTFIRGYGEEALCALATRPGRPRVIGVHHAGDADPCEQATVQLEALASPWLDGTIPLDGQRFVRWETQRGCPFRCAFCQHREAGARLPRRDLDATRIAREIELFCAHRVESIAVLDPIFNSGAHALDVLRRFAEHGFRGRLSLQCRAETIDEAFLDAAGRLNVCLELGLQTIHPAEGRAVKRNNRVGMVSAALAALRDRQIDHEVSLIFGLPEQTLGSFCETVRWCLERRIPVIKAFPLLLLRGTALDGERDRWGFVTSRGSMPMVVTSRSFDQADWLQMARISEALRLTEGRHPESFSDLLALARETEPDCARWLSHPEDHHA